MGGSKWMKAKALLGLKLNSCLYVSRTGEDSAVAGGFVGGRFSDAAAAVTSPRDSDHQVKMPTTPTPSSSGLRLPKQFSKSGKNICAICLGTMKPGHGHAIFTAECSHAFHFHCIASNVKHGKQTCPVCRAKWKEIPLQIPTAENFLPRPPRTNNNVRAPTSRRSPRADPARNSTPLFSPTEPTTFNDDDEIATHEPGHTPNIGDVDSMVEVKTYPEVSAVPKSNSQENFSILVNLKALVATGQTSRAPVDLVTVLDVSGSMAGTKLALLKRAMGFVIQNLGPSDRLSVIAFSSTARRLFALRKMTEIGKQEALLAVNSLTSNGGTNIAEALRKGSRVMNDRKFSNPISSIILLSDGQDTYSTTNSMKISSDNNQNSLLPDSMHRDSVSGLHIPVHSFGFGSDHDAVTMHSISEASGGTFSFIEAEGVIQDAFAQCIGGLLSVVAQELKVEVECVDRTLTLVSVKSGSYRAVLENDRRKASIKFGDLYAEEERDFLANINIPINESRDEMLLLKVRCCYTNPISKKPVSLDSSSGVVKIQRPVKVEAVKVSMEVDRQRNRLQSAEAMAEARAAAERGDLSNAVSVLEDFRQKLSETVSAKAGDRLCAALDAELMEMQERMANQQVYETSGRAYVLSGLSSHSWQRATARGDSTETTSLVQSYQTQSMVDMVTLSQTMVFSGPLPRPVLRPVRSFPDRVSPR